MGTARRLLYLTGSAAIFVVLLEVGARLFLEGAGGNFTPVPTSIRREATFPGVDFLLAPDTETVHEFGSDPRGYFDPGAKLTYRTNAHGFRGPETTLAKPDGVFRIVGLGDSFTFGTGVRREHTFLAVLEERANLAGPDAPYEVLNLGVMAYDTVAEVSLLEHIGFRFEPDLVVIAFFLNDVGSGNLLAFTGEEGEDTRPWWRRTFRSLDALYRGDERREEGARVIETYRRSLGQRAPRWNEAKRALLTAKGLAEERGFDLALAIFPVLWQLSNYPLPDVHAKVAGFCRDNGIPVLDLLPAFRGHDGPELWVHPKNQHPNEIAHEIAGEALFRFLVDEGFLVR